MSEPDPNVVLDTLLARCDEIRTPCGDGSLVWRVWGDESARRDVVLLHGGFGAWNHWVRTIPVLEPRFRVIAADLPGCGDSDDPPKPYDAASLAALLSDGLNRSVPGDAPFDLVSFSFGGVLSGQIAADQSHRIRSLTIVGSPILGLTGTGPANELAPVPPDLPPHQAAPLYRGNLEKLMVRDPRSVDDLAMTLHMANMGKARLRSRGIARTPVLAESLRSLPCRLNCVFGEYDVTLHPDLAGVRAFVEEVHPDADFHIVRNAGHWVQYEAAAPFNAILLDLLATAGGRQ